MTIQIPVPERFLSEAYLSVVSDVASKLKCNFHDKALQDMQLAAKAGYPHEVCGLLVGNASAEGWEVKSVRQIENLNKERASDRFELDPAGYQQVDRELRGSGQEIIGVYHSHPDCPAQPSPTDLGSAWEGFVYPIISVVEGEVAAVNCWILNADDEAAPYFQKLNQQG